MIRDFLNWLLGPRCCSCGQRVPPRNIARHYLVEHAGDRL